MPLDCNSSGKKACDTAIYGQTLRSNSFLASGIERSDMGCGVSGARVVDQDVKGKIVC